MVHLHDLRESMHVVLNRNGMRLLKSQKSLFLQHLHFRVQNKAVTQKKIVLATTKSTFMRMGDFVCTESHEVS